MKPKRKGRQPTRKTGGGHSQEPPQETNKCETSRQVTQTRGRVHFCGPHRHPSDSETSQHNTPNRSAGSKGPKSNMERKARQETDAGHIAAPEGKKPAQHTSACGNHAVPPRAPRTTPKEPRGGHRGAQNGSHSSGGEKASSAQQAAMEGGWLRTSRNAAGGKRPVKRPAPNQETIRNL